ncbi:hypothetical protein [Burkholderia seminalis]|uniref:hypothetical protein n=1 Tax=Burkholderia seminalis TaxID=488731 RepID=UPI00158ACFEC|nr:hypothetical protein [Burkholderia seminalis]
MTCKIVTKATLLGFIGLVSIALNGCQSALGSHRPQLVCDSFERLPKCLDQARAQGLSDVEVAHNNKSYGLVEGWPENMKMDQYLVQSGAFPQVVLQIDQQIAAILPEIERILKTGDWAKYPAWRAQYVWLNDRLQRIITPSAQRAYDAAAPARAWMAEHGGDEERAKRAGNNGNSQQCLRPIGAGPDGLIMGMVTCQ